ncbi:MAG TPA: hypothetical protein VHX38_01985 [Pseudonocardiaceae bacterium]|jgi:hypothetical protein|nr:hypothetical protein [Pseudonocardiaceae bacterium]
MCRVEDCDPWDVVTETRPLAHKSHCCTECGRTIQTGEPYLRIKGHCGGRWEEHKICQHCDAASEVMSVMCHGWPLGDLLDELVEHWREGYCSVPYGRLIARMRRKWHDGADMVPTGCRELANALLAA